jgi:transketolase
VRNRFADVFYEMGRADDRLCIVVADISPAGSISKFRNDFPDRFVNTGVAEQAMIGIAAGMALRGLRPFAYTIATFALYRPFEFIRNDLCYQGVPVTVVGIGGGLTYSTLGATHHAMEDIAVACAVPNLRVIAPCDPDEVEAATRWCAGQTEGPVYLRLGKAGEPNLTKAAEDPWQFGKVRMLRRVDGAKTIVLTYGAIAHLALQVADALRESGEAASVLAVSTLKPLDVAGIAKALGDHSRVIVIEEMVPSGSLGGRVREVAWTMGAACRIDLFGLKDEFVHCYGSHSDILAAHGLSLPSIMQQLRIDS